MSKMSVKGGGANQSNSDSCNVHTSNINEEEAVLKLGLSFKMSCDSKNNVSYLSLKWDGEEENSNNNIETLEVVWNLKYIQTLEFINFPHHSIPDQIGNLSKSLEHLTINCCHRLLQIPNGIGNMENLQTLEILSCRQLQSLPSAIGNLKRLNKLKIDFIEHLETLPPEIGHLENLTELEIGRCNSLISLPTEIRQLRKLKELTVCSLPRLQSQLADFLPFQSSLQDLNLLCLPAVTRFENVSLDRLQNLTTLFLGRLESISIAIQKLPKLERLSLHAMPRQAVLSFFSKPWAGTRGPREIYTDGGLCSSCSSHLADDKKLGNDYASILPGLPLSLERICFNNHGIQSLSGFLEQGLPPKVEVLQLRGNPVLESSRQEDQDSLHNILETYPYLGCVCHDLKPKLFTNDSQYLLYLNRCGRVLLLGNENPIPLSVWPLVLERVKTNVAVLKKKSTRMEASVLFFLLHGPALLNRVDGFETGAETRKCKFASSG